MPIPDGAPDGSADAGAVVVALFRQLHAQLRDELAGMPEEALNHVPCDGANSVATIVTHLLGSEAETMRVVAGVPCERDRDGEFTTGPQDASALLARVHAADGLLDELESLLTPARLRAEVALPTLPDDAVRAGITWLVGNYGHAREHLGQLFLTKQLALAAR